jgi:hypothetical protein
MIVGRGENLLCIEAMYFSTHTRYRIIVADDTNLTSPQSLSFSLTLNVEDLVGLSFNGHHPGLGLKILLPKHQYDHGLLSSVRNKIPDHELVFHLEAHRNVILKIFPCLDYGSVFTPMGTDSSDTYDC